MKSILQIRFLLPAAIVAAVLYCLWIGECRLLTPDQRAFRLYGKGMYQESAMLFEDPEWRGVALYKAGDFKAAATVFGGLDSVSGAYNQGNCLVFLGRYAEAVQRYDRSLELDPDFESARINRAIARARGEALKTEGENMTDGAIGADDFVFNEGGKNSPDAGEEQVNEAQPASDAELQARWLRQVQTRPVDFLRSKFAYQYAMQIREEDP